MNLSDAKQAIRERVLAARNALADRAARSQRVVERAVQSPEYRSADRVCWYVNVRSEVETLPAIERCIADGPPVVVPWCVDRTTLALFDLRSLDELVVGRFGILEPAVELRQLSERAVDPQSVDLFFVPGVAFDSAGHRLGHGAGYYDRLLENARPDAVKVGLAFDCQIVEAVPAAPHDIAMDAVITESASYRR